MAGRCQFHSSGAGYLHDVHQTEVRARARPLSDPQPVFRGHGPVPVGLSWPQRVCDLSYHVSGEERGICRHLHPGLTVAPHPLVQSVWLLR